MQRTDIAEMSIHTVPLSLLQKSKSQLNEARTDDRTGTEALRRFWRSRHLLEDQLQACYCHLWFGAPHIPHDVFHDL